MTTRYRKKPVIVDAIRAIDAIALSRHSWVDMPKWLRDAYEEGRVIFSNDRVHLDTSVPGAPKSNFGNPQRATVPATDWIMKGVKGELYPCEASVFAETYEAVDG